MDFEIKQKILNWLNENYRIKIAQPDDYFLWHKDAPGNDGLNYETDLVDAVQDEFPQDEYGCGLPDEEVAEVAKEWALSHMENE